MPDKNVQSLTPVATTPDKVNSTTAITKQLIRNTGEKRPIMIQGAMDVETEKLASALDDMKKIEIDPWTFYKGTINGYPVVISRTEIGMTNAAAATALGIEEFNPIAIINQGTAGGHDPKLHRYDIVLGKKTVNFGAFDTTHKDRGEGISPESWTPRSIEVPIIDGRTVEAKSFKGDSKLLEIADNVKGKYTKGKVVEGVIGSADEWNKEIDRILWISKTFETSSEDMETASAAQVAEAYGIPFLGIRVLSDNEINNEDYDRTSGKECQEYVMDVVKAYINTTLPKHSLANPVK